ncbi:MAG: recombinase family protein [Plesiomonas sp.]|uniref:recombinase family protein n=1 Tax=Plesiomonas sp. TaxID=2486279 RepID=UPI003F40D35C
MIIGYARVSTTYQDTEMQQVSLRAYGCDEIYEETRSGKTMNRPVINHVLSIIKTGDELVVWKSDRLGRNILQALVCINELHARGVIVKSITDGVDTRTAAGRFTFRTMLNVAQYEAELISERTKAGQAVARTKGRFPGRPPRMKSCDWARAEDMIAAGISHSSVAHEFGISIKTVYKYIPKNTNQQQ